jgi:AhpD family alkylhydroperoxidase
MNYNKERWSIAVCGLNCASCFIYHKRDENDADVQREIRETIKWFREEKQLDLSKKDLVCTGCLGSLDVHWSPDCQMMLCAREKNLTQCFQCEDFPCPHVEEFAADGLEHHRRAVERSERMKEIGLEAWIAEQEAKS